MPTKPLKANRRIDAPLQNLVVAAVQEESAFMGPLLAPFVDVEFQTGKYFTVSKGAYNQMYMQNRGSATKSQSAGWELSSDSYSCSRKAVNHPEDWYDLADEDPILRSDQEAAEFLKNQGLMELDTQVAAVAMLAGSWTLDLDWNASSETPGTDVYQFDKSGSDPQVSVQYIKQQIRNKVFKAPNVMAVGSNVHNDLLTNSIVRAAIQYTARTDLASLDDERLMAAFFGIENYRVVRSMYTSSNPATAEASRTLASIIDEDDVFIGYVSPTPGRKTISAMYTFAWRAGGEATNGMITRSYSLEDYTADFKELEVFWDVKQVSADCGCFIDGSTYT